LAYPDVLCEKSNSQPSLVKAIFALVKSNYLKTIKLSPSMALAKIMCKPAFANKETTTRIAENCAKLTKTIPCYDLYFYPTPDIWKYVKSLD